MFVRVPASVTSFPVVYANWLFGVDINCPSGTTFMQKATQLNDVPMAWEQNCADAVWMRLGR